MKKIVLIIMLLLLVSTAFAEKATTLTKEQIQQIREEIYRYVEDTYKREGGKRNKDDIREDYIEGEMARAYNANASRYFNEKDFDACKVSVEFTISQANKRKVKLNVMPMVREAQELAYFILADCYVAEIMEKISVTGTSTVEMFQKERARAEKAKEYYSKVTNVTLNPTRAAVANFNLGGIHIFLGDQKKGEQFFGKAFRDNKFFSYVKSEEDKGNRILFIFHNERVLSVKK